MINQTIEFYEKEIERHKVAIKRLRAENLLLFFSSMKKKLQNKLELLREIMNDRQNRTLFDIQPKFIAEQRLRKKFERTLNRSLTHRPDFTNLYRAGDVLLRFRWIKGQMAIVLSAVWHCSACISKELAGYITRFV